MATKLNLQADFAPVSAQAWKDKIIADSFVARPLPMCARVAHACRLFTASSPSPAASPSRLLKYHRLLKKIKNERMKSVQFLPIFHSFLF